MKAFVVFGAVGAYLAFIGLMIFLSLRWVRRRRRARDDVLTQGLAAAGAELVGTAPMGGWYTGTTRDFELAGQRFAARNYAVSRYYYRSDLSVAAPPLPAISIIPEGMVERFGKAIGLNREVQTGDQAFDDAAYVDTIEEDAPVRQVLDSVAVRDGIRELLSFGYKVQLSARGLEAYQLLPHGTAPNVAHVGEAVALLGRIAAALPRLERSTFKGTVPFLWLRALAFILMWIPPMLLAGVLDGLMHSPGARVLSMGHKPLILGVGALTAWILYVVLVGLWLRGRSYAFRLVLVASAFGLLGIPLCGAMTVLAANQGLDGSAAVERVATVIRTSKYKGECRINVGSWVDASREESLPVKCKDLARLAHGSDVRLEVHEGALGMPWVEPIHLAD
jgi:hypothetical protein